MVVDETQLVDQIDLLFRCQEPLSAGLVLGFLSWPGLWRRSAALVGVVDLDDFFTWSLIAGLRLCSRSKLR